MTTLAPTRAARGFVSDVAVVAIYELQQALRKRLLQVLVLAYAAAMGAAHYGFVQLLAQLEHEAAVTLGVAATEKPGTLIGEVLRSETLREVLGDLVGSPALLDRLLDTPVLALWSGMVAMVLLPALVLVGTSGAVAAELESRSIRFLALRTERLPIVLGKLVGQMAILALAALAGVAVSEAAALGWMVGVSPLPMLLGSLEHTARAWVFALPYAGLGLAVSQWIGRTNLARLAALFLVVVAAVASPLLHHYASPSLPGRLLDLLRLFLPGTGWVAVWSSDAFEFAMTTAWLGGLCMIWTGLGYLRFDRRDL